MEQGSDTDEKEERRLMRRTLMYHSIAVLLTFVYVACAPLQTSTPIPQDIINRIDEFFRERVEKQAFSGSILIAQRDEILLRSSYGMADIENAIPNTSQTVFHLGSVTKQFTAMAVLMLQAQEKIDLEKEVCTYISNCPGSWKEITIHQLLTHTSGLPDRWEFYAEKNKPGVSYDLHEIVSWFEDEPLDFKPGNRFSYSSTGYLLLGLLIEEVSGQSYAGFLYQQIFEPLGMVNTGFAHEVTDLAVGYSYKGFETQFINPTLASSAGGLVSTVEDIYRWDRSFYTEELAPQKVIDQIFTPYVSIPHFSFAPPYDELSYGYGWFVGKYFGHRVAGHGGTYDGFRALNEHYPDDEISIIILSNLESSDVRVTTFPSEAIFTEE
jgi:CubicO group peptidase (beta-lactamase class C family)